MALPKQRHTHYRCDRARKELELTPIQTKKCEQCGAPALSHRVCPTCGTYKGRTVIDTTPKRKTVAAAKA